MHRQQAGSTGSSQPCRLLKGAVSVGMAASPGVHGICAMDARWRQLILKAWGVRRQSPHATGRTPACLILWHVSGDIHGMYIQLQFALVHYLAVRLTTVMNEGACYCASPVLWSFVH